MSVHRDMLPSTLSQWHFVGVLIFIETHRRVLGDAFGTIPTPLKDDAFAQYGYCIDAPQRIPGGGMMQDFIQDDPQAIPSQIEIDRDE